MSSTLGESRVWNVISKKQAFSIPNVLYCFAWMRHDSGMLLGIITQPNLIGTFISLSVFTCPGISIQLEAGQRMQNASRTLSLSEKPAFSMPNVLIASLG